MRTLIHKTLCYLRQKGIVLGGVIGLTVGIFSTSAAFAAIPDNDGIIHACRNNLQATIRIIDSASASCTGSETELNWNTASTGQFVSNLVGADFTSTSLSYRHLAGQDMHGSNFTNSVLNGANLDSANLSSSTMGPHGTTILARNTNFTDANLNNIEILGTIDLTGANLSGATLNGASFVQSSTILGGDFRTANLTNAQFHGYFDMGNFNGVDFRALAQNNDAVFADADLSGAFFNGMNLGTGTQFHNVNMTNTNFTDATVKSLFRGTTISGTNFTDTSFIEADLRSVNFEGGVFTNATWSDTWCPDATFSSNNGDTCIGHLTP